MTNSKEELIQKIESAREVLNKSLDEKKQYDEVYQNSILLDTLSFFLLRKCKNRL